MPDSIPGNVKVVLSGTGELPGSYKAAELVGFDAVSVGEPGKMGLLDAHGNELMPKEYKSFRSLLPTGPILATKNNGDCALLSRDGQLITGFDFQELGFLSNRRMDKVFFYGKQNGKMGVINQAGETLIPFTYDAISAKRTLRGMPLLIVCTTKNKASTQLQTIYNFDGQQLASVHGIDVKLVTPKVFAVTLHQEPDRMLAYKMDGTLLLADTCDAVNPNTTSYNTVGVYVRTIQREVLAFDNNHKQITRDAAKEAMEAEKARQRKAKGIPRIGSAFIVGKELGWLNNAGDTVVPARRQSISQIGQCLLVRDLSLPWGENALLLDSTGKQLAGPVSSISQGIPYTSADYPVLQLKTPTSSYYTDLYGQPICEQSLASMHLSLVRSFENHDTVALILGKQGQHWGVWDMDNNNILPPRFKSIETLYTDILFKVRIDDELRIVHRNGTVYEMD